MKYFATVDDQTYEISVEGTGRITVDGVEVSADMQRIGRLDLYSLLLDNVSHEVYVEPDGDQRNTLRRAGRRHTLPGQGAGRASRRLALADRSLKPPGRRAGDQGARSPGLVVRVAVTPGQAVGEGETLVILEAMKMENELRAPRAGTVHEVRVEPGDAGCLGAVAAQPSLIEQLKGGESRETNRTRVSTAHRPQSTCRSGSSSRTFWSSSRTSARSSCC